MHTWYSAQITTGHIFFEVGGTSLILTLKYFSAIAQFIAFLKSQIILYML